ncbi:MAG: NlpC/P60 family protein [Firmicutes bacterium]|nr:NlpC/P60 family protein [Bacillota bacterium]
MPVLPVMASQSNSSEMVTQLLYNERVRILANNGKWTKILAVDQGRTEQGYPGWVEADKLRLVDDCSINGGSWAVISQPTAKLYRELKNSAPVTQIYFGTYLKYLGYVKDPRTYPSGKPLYWLKVSSLDGQIGWVVYDYVTIKEKSPFSGSGNMDDIICSAQVFLNTPYLWGGMTTKGIDCSGLIYMAYRQNGIVLPRDADQQYMVGEPVYSPYLQPGDLLFYGSGDSATHVAMYAGDGWMLESNRADGVVLRNMDYKKSFIGARRIVRN